MVMLITTPFTNLVFILLSLGSNELLITFFVHNFSFNVVTATFIIYSLSNKKLHKSVGGNHELMQF